MELPPVMVQPAKEVAVAVAVQPQAAKPQVGAKKKPPTRWQRIGSNLRVTAGPFRCGLQVMFALWVSTSFLVTTPVRDNIPRASWQMISIVFLAEGTVGATSHKSFLRILGTTLGCVVGPCLLALHHHITGGKDEAAADTILVALMGFFVGCAQFGKSLFTNNAYAFVQFSLAVCLTVGIDYKERLQFDGAKAVETAYWRAIQVFFAACVIQLMVRAVLPNYERDKTRAALTGVLRDMGKSYAKLCAMFDDPEGDFPSVNVHLGFINTIIKSKGSITDKTFWEPFLTTQGMVPYIVRFQTKSLGPLCGYMDQLACLLLSMHVPMEDAAFAESVRQLPQKMRNDLKQVGEDVANALAAATKVCGISRREMLRNSAVKEGRAALLDEVVDNIVAVQDDLDVFVEDIKNYMNKTNETVKALRQASLRPGMAQDEFLKNIISKVKDHAADDFVGVSTQPLEYARAFCNDSLRMLSTIERMIPLIEGYTDDTLVPAPSYPFMKFAESTSGESGRLKRLRSNRERITNASSMNWMRAKAGFGVMKSLAALNMSWTNEEVPVTAEKEAEGALF